MYNELSNFYQFDCKAWPGHISLFCKALSLSCFRPPSIAFADREPFFLLSLFKCLTHTLHDVFIEKILVFFKFKEIKSIHKLRRAGHLKYSKHTHIHTYEFNDETNSIFLITILSSQQIDRILSVICFSEINREKKNTRILLRCV